MTSDILWPWITIAAMGALHGLHPATGWGLAMAWSLRAHDRSIPLRALLPMAAGHLASVAPVAAAVAWGRTLPMPVLLGVAGGLCGVMVLAHGSDLAPRGLRKPAGPVGMALWSFAAATAHGAGLALVPALAPLCLGDGGAGGGASGGGTPSTPLLLALAALGVHTVAMLAASAAMAAAGCHGVLGATRWLRHHQHRTRRPTG